MSQQRSPDIENQLPRPHTRLVIDETAWQYIWRNVRNVSFWAGFIKLMEFATGLALLGITSLQLSSSQTSSSSYNGVTTSISGTNIISLLTSLLTPIVNAGIFSWDSIPWLKGSSLSVYKMVLSGSEVVQFAVWLATAIWYTVMYSNWDCSDPETLLVQYKQTDALSDYTAIYGKEFNFNQSSVASVGSMSDITGLDNDAELEMAMTGITNLFDAFNVTSFKISCFDEDSSNGLQTLIADLKRDCELKKGTTAVSWVGVGLFIMSILLVAWSWYRHTHEKRPAESDLGGGMPFVILELKSDELPPPPILSLSDTTLIETPRSDLHECTDGTIYTRLKNVLIRDMRSFLLQFEVWFSGYEDVFFLDVVCARNFEAVDNEVQTTVTIQDPKDASQNFRSNYGNDVIVNIQYLGDDSHASHLKRVVLSPSVEKIPIAYIELTLRGNGSQPAVIRKTEMAHLLEKLKLLMLSPDIEDRNAFFDDEPHRRKASAATTKDLFNFEKPDDLVVQDLQLPQGGVPMEHAATTSVLPDLRPHMSSAPNNTPIISIEQVLDTGSPLLKPTTSLTFTPIHGPSSSVNLPLTRQRPSPPFIQRNIDDTFIAREEWNHWIQMERSREERSLSPPLRARSKTPKKVETWDQKRKMELEAIMCEIERLAKEEEKMEREASSVRKYRLSRSLLFPEKI